MVTLNWRDIAQQEFDAMPKNYQADWQELRDLVMR
jgi:hypothetical protein